MLIDFLKRDEVIHFACDTFDNRVDFLLLAVF